MNSIDKELDLTEASIEVGTENGPYIKASSTTALVRQAQFKCRIDFPFLNNDKRENPNAVTLPTINNI